MGDEAEVDGNLVGQASLFWGGTTWRLMFLPILSGFGLKLFGRLKLVMHCSATIKKIERAMVSLLRLVVSN